MKVYCISLAVIDFPFLDFLDLSGRVCSYRILRSENILFLDIIYLLFLLEEKMLIFKSLHEQSNFCHGK